MMTWNGQRRRRLVAGMVVLSVGGAFAVSPAAAFQLLPQPKYHVEDRAGVMDRTTFQRLEGYLAELEQKTGAQMIVLTIKSTEGQNIVQYAMALAEHWKLGQKGKDNGLLVVVATQDRRYRIETGYGIEGVLPDALCDSMARQYFVPNFKRGDFAKGIFDGSVALATRIAKESGVTISGMPAKPIHQGRGAHRGGGRRGRGGLSAFACPIVPIILIAVMFSARRRGRGYRTWGGSSFPWWMLLFLGSGSRSHFGGGGWGGGGGFGGGGFGGFGGGGGGGFGGGGASGSW